MKEFFEEKYDFGELKIEKIVMDNGVSCEVFLPENPRERILFNNEHCEFKPVGFVRTDFGWMPLVYKLVTEDLWSLELRRNPTPMNFPVGKWIFEERDLEYSNKDFGGIWTAIRKGNMSGLRKHCRETWDMETRGFLTAVYNPIAFVGNYRIKSEGVMLMKEVY